MKLYIFGEKINDRVMSALHDVHPISISEIPSEAEQDSFFFVQDTILKELQESEIKSLFIHRVMVLSFIPDFLEAQNYLNLGAMGYGNAMMHESHLHSAYQALQEGKVWLHPDFITSMIKQMQENTKSKSNGSDVLNILSHREREVALMLGNGATHQEIADTLDITVRTVKAHATAIYQKLSLKDRLALSLLLHS